MAAGGDEIGQVPRHVPEAVAVLPEAAPESPPPSGVGVESLHMLVVELVEPRPVEIKKIDSFLEMILISYQYYCWDEYIQS